MPAIASTGAMLFTGHKGTSGKSFPIFGEGSTASLEDNHRFPVLRPDTMNVQLMAVNVDHFSVGGPPWHS
jgi:hypothetical protein